MMLVAILLPALFALAAFAINIAYIETVKTDIQIATDAAARAAGRTYAMTSDENLSLLAAQEAANRNRIADNVVLPITAGDLDFGVSDRGSMTSPYVFDHTGGGNSVRLTTRTLNTNNANPIFPVFPFFGSTQEIRPLMTATSTQGVIDIALVVDRSGSMAYGSTEVAQYPPNPIAAPPGWDFGDPVPPGARWLDLIAAVQVFINQLNASPQEELLSLSMYNQDPTTPQNLTVNYQDIIDSLTVVSANFQKGGTNIGSGVNAGLNAVIDPAYARPHASKVIVVMTDGVHNIGWNPVSAATSVADNGVTVFTITFSDEADQGLMQQVADKCGGEHFHAVTAAQLQDAFRSIARRLPTLLTD